jgi:hypothetical protein
MNALHKIADFIKALADEVDKGELVASDDLRLAATRLNAQAEMMDLGL